MNTYLTLPIIPLLSKYVPAGGDFICFEVYVILGEKKQALTL